MKRLRIAVLVLIVCSGLYLLFRESDIDPVVESDESQNDIIGAEQSVSERQESLFNDELVMDKAVQIEKLRDAIRDSNVPIEFFGQIVDEDGLAIGGALVKLKVPENELNAEGTDVLKIVHMLELTTDEKGLFSVLGKFGSSLRLESVEKEGYRLAGRQKKGFSYSRPDFALDANRDNPFQYVMIREDDESKMFRTSYKIGSPWDGEAIHLNLKDGVGSGEPDLVLIPVRGELIDRRRDWLFSVNTPGGGILVAPEYPGGVAPEMGYLDHFEIGYDRDEYRYRSSLNLTAFVRMKDGIYGRVAISVYSDRGREDSVSIILDVLLNESGGRVLDEE